jgi:MioC protein
MSEIQILVGSTLGTTEYVAEAAQIHLEEMGFDTELYLDPDLNDLSLQLNQIWLICLSTHGAGDYPDNFKGFVEQLQQVNAALTEVRYAVIGLGDSNYDDYCQAAKNIDLILQEMGAVNISDRCEIDVQLHSVPEDQVLNWMPLLVEDLNKLEED